MTLPNFMIIGMPKAGTTSLYDHLRAHPDVFMPRLKETRFFGYEGSGTRQKFPIQSLEEYTALFEGATGESAIGEATPHYLIYPRAAERIHALLPGARLIASLRNPVDRSYSVYQMNLRDRDANRGVPFVAAIRTDPNLQETYAEKLARYFALFPREQIRVILLEELEAKPEKTVQALFSFLGVDPGYRPDLSKISNPGGEPKIKLLHDLMNQPGIRAMGRRLLPQGALERAKAVRSRNLRKSGLSAEERSLAAGFFRDDIRRTQDLIGRDLSHWLAA
jgi:hypothetical protein